MPRRVVGPGFHDDVYRVVRTVPAGRVTTYGDVAAALGARSVARHVGWALAALPEGSDVPWHRVVNSRGRVSPHGPEPGPGLQGERLRAEGVDVDDAGRIAGFKDVRYQPPLPEEPR